MVREQLLLALITKCGSLVRAAQAVDPQMTDPTADYGLYALAMDQALRQMNVAETSLSDDTVVAAQPALELLWRATYEAYDTLCDVFAGQNDIRVQHTAGDGVQMSDSQLYKQAADRREAARKAVENLTAWSMSYLPLDYLEPAPTEFSRP
jgi:hypothetical protein